MTQRPNRPNISSSVGDLFSRMREIDRLHNGPWIYVGSGTALPDGFTSPAFQNGWTNSGGGLQELRFRWLRNGGLEIEGSITGGASGSVVFSLPNDPIYLNATGEFRFPAVDDSDNLVTMAVLANGDVRHRSGGGGSGNITFGGTSTGTFVDIHTTGSTSVTGTCSGTDAGFAVIDDGGGIVLSSPGEVNIQTQNVLQLDGCAGATMNCNFDAYFFNNATNGYFFNNGFFEYSGSGFEIDSTGGVFISNFSNTNLMTIENFGSTDLFIGSLGGGKIIFENPTGTPNAMEIWADGSIHIPTGTAIIADL